MQASLKAIFIASVKGKPMVMVDSARALTGQGLEGDHYRGDQGVCSCSHQSKRQVSLISSESFEGVNFLYVESWRNLITQGVEVNSLIGKHFTIGKVLFRGVKYWEPCVRVNRITDKNAFGKVFWERGGIIAEVFSDGIIQPGDPIQLFEYNAENMKRFVEQHSPPFSVPMASQSVLDSLPVR
jgi:MOSC domain-containing protein YiiM